MATSKQDKGLRIRDELLPQSARYIVIDGTEYIALPVADFGDWYEDIELGAILDDRRRDSGPSIPFDEAVDEIKGTSRNACFQVCDF